MKARARGMGANCVVGYNLADFHISHDSNNIICVICLTGNAALYDEEIWFIILFKSLGSHADEVDSMDVNLCSFRDL